MTEPSSLVVNMPKKNIERLLTIMQQLRDLQTGCPWDQKQTWQSIIPHTLEEVHEVADAIERNDAHDLKDELGDLLFQVVFLAQIAEDQQLFTFEDVAGAISDKMVRRHPHVFSDATFDNEAQQKQAWEAIKQQERDKKGEQGVFDGIAATLPTLRRAQKLQQRAAQVGFDWENWQQVVPKVHEELEEVADAKAQDEPFERVEEEVGDVLLAVSNMARKLGVNAENALRLANNKFERRFLRVTALLEADGIDLDAASLAQMEQAWIMAKHEEKY